MQRRRWMVCVVAGFAVAACGSGSRSTHPAAPAGVSAGTSAGAPTSSPLGAPDPDSIPSTTPLGSATAVTVTPTTGAPAPTVGRLTTTTARRGTTTTVTPALTSTTGQATTVAPTTTSTTALSCRNSFDARCGAFRWDPTPSDQPPKVTVTTPLTAKAGQPFTLGLNATDPDSPKVFVGVSSWGDTNESTHGDPWWAFFRCTTAYGPWDTPSTSAGEADVTEKHTYSAPGQYTIDIQVTSYLYEASRDLPGGSGNEAGVCLDPYRGGRFEHVSVSVTQ